MHRTIYRFVFAAALGCCLTGFAQAGDEHDHGDHGHGASAEEQAKMMEIFAKYVQPSEEHKQFADAVGSWNYTSKWWMTPDADPMSDAGTMQAELAHDGHYLIEQVKGTTMGMPFSGTALSGYDRYNEEYFTVWVDNMGTGFMVMKGQKTGDTITYEGTYDDFWAGQDDKWMKMTVTENNPNQNTIAMYSQDENGKEFKTMEMVYTRAKVASN